MNRTETRPGNALVEAMAALARLEVVVVARCPAPACPLCGAAVPAAA